jgi:hypothetical protein
VAGDHGLKSDLAAVQAAVAEWLGARAGDTLAGDTSPPARARR